MSKIIIDLSMHVVYRHLPSGSLIAVDTVKASKIRQELSKNGNIFHQIPPEEKVTVQLFTYNPETDSHYLNGNLEVIKIQDLDHLPLFTRILLDIKKLLGIKPWLKRK